MIVPPVSTPNRPQRPQSGNQISQLRPVEKSALPGKCNFMTIAQSKVTAQGRIPAPVGVQKKHGIGPGSVLEWHAEWQDDPRREAGHPKAYSTTACSRLTRTFLFNSSHETTPHASHLNLSANARSSKSGRCPLASAAQRKLNSRWCSASVRS